MKISIKSSFIIALLVLGCSAFALEGATRFLKLHFRKEAVPLPIPLEQIAANFGPWIQVSTDRPLQEDIEHTLGTSQYIFRNYLDSRVLNKETLDQFKDKSAGERDVMFTDIQRQNPEAAVSLAVTYYTGLVDTVAHVPDRCYIADGYDTDGAHQQHWSAGGKGLDVRFLAFEDSTGVGRVSRNVAYLFQVDGQYVCDPLDVRRVLANLFTRYGYYAKVEVMTILPDHDKSAKVMDDFLGSAMPAIETVMPDWKQYKAKN